MRIVIVRHGDPDYAKDSLTPRGWKEAEALSDRLASMKVDEWYCSPLGRAQDTASCTMKKLGREPIIKDWLRECTHPVQKPRQVRGEIDDHIAWDWLPKDWADRKAFHDNELWAEEPELSVFDLASYYENVSRNLDELLSTYGYRREGNLYRTEDGNTRTIVFFCHFGLECMLLGHLLNISPMDLWHGFVAAPTSVTILHTEEREKGYAYWRTACFGDVSHLYAKGIEPSFAARFAEVYDSSDPTCYHGK
ncbi:MAG: histidine phosphatase family protein [Spirochaetales bacterium]|nr:histidine phosphatase family protein [Candidatus Physcosoma equi]